ncbi:diguanylate cyclase domain-containing protein [Cupriavidus basilensis]
MPAATRCCTSAAARLTDCIGPGDVIARLGGDEFVILIDQRVEGKRIALLAERLLQAMREPFDTVNGRYYLGVSIGVALYPHDGISGSDLLRSADAAMYRAAAERPQPCPVLYGRAQRPAATPLHAGKRAARCTREQRTAARLSTQVRPGQPSHRRGRGAAALEQRQACAISPVEFIPVAEETGLIVPIGAWVLTAPANRL